MVETIEASVGVPPPDQLDNDLSVLVKEPPCDTEEVIAKQPAGPKREQENNSIESVGDKQAEATVSGTHHPPL